LYEIVRQKLHVGPLDTPKHEKIIELMRVFWDEETIRVLAQFPDAGNRIKFKELLEKTGMEKRQLRRILSRASTKKTINKHDVAGYCLEPLLPGVFEAYFIAREDTQENLKKAAVLYREIFGNGEIMGRIWDPDFRFFRPLLPTSTNEKLVEIGEGFDAESCVLPYELVEDIINKNEEFAVIPCQCRFAGELNGEPCSVAPSEMGCLTTGPSVKMIVASGMGKGLTKAEAIDFLKRTEKAGLVHNTSNSKGGEHLSFICNCCSCHCGVLKSVKDHHVPIISPSNFQPRIDLKICVECETCMKKCQMGAITHPEKGQMEIDMERCIGCGVCASNCAKGALKMHKARDVVPPDKNKIGNKYFNKILGELLRS
nr:4Fe-4S dicluster domain-containing protein [Candidatus Sigynarchaeota archaeon]